MRPFIALLALLATFPLQAQQLGLRLGISPAVQASYGSIELVPSGNAHISVLYNLSVNEKLTLHTGLGASMMSTTGYLSSCGPFHIIVDLQEKIFLVDVPFMASFGITEEQAQAKRKPFTLGISASRFLDVEQNWSYRNTYFSLFGQYNFWHHRTSQFMLQIGTYLQATTISPGCFGFGISPGLVLQITRLSQ